MFAEGCAGCGRTDGFITDYTEGIVVCRLCGRVKESGLMDDSSELCSFAKDCSEFGLTDTRRVGAPNNPLFVGSGLGTVISKDRSGLSHWGLRVPDSRIDSGLLRGFRSIEEYSSSLHLAQHLTYAVKEVFKKCYSAKKTSRLQSVNSLIAAIFFYVCRKQKVNKPIGDILEVVQCKADLVHKMYKEVKEVLKLQLNDDVLLSYTVKYASGLKLSDTVSRAATMVAKLAYSQGFAAFRHPLILAAAAVYLASQTSPTEAKSVSDVCRVSKITETTLKGAVKDLAPLKGHLEEHLEAPLSASLLNSLG